MAGGERLRGPACDPGRLWAATRASGRKDVRRWEGCWEVDPARRGNCLNEGDRAESASGLGVALLPLQEGPSPVQRSSGAACARRAFSPPVARGYEGACQSGLRSGAGQRAQGLNQGKGFCFCGVNNLAVGDPERPGLWGLHGVVETQAPGLMLCHRMTMVFMLLRWRLARRPVCLPSRQEGGGMQKGQEKESDHKSPL